MILSKAPHSRFLSPWKTLTCTIKSYKSKMEVRDVDGEETISEDQDWRVENWKHVCNFDKPTMNKVSRHTCSIRATSSLFAPIATVIKIQEPLLHLVPETVTFHQRYQLKQAILCLYRISEIAISTSLATATTTTTTTTTSTTSTKTTSMKTMSYNNYINNNNFDNNDKNNRQRWWLQQQTTMMTTTTGDDDDYNNRWRWWQLQQQKMKTTDDDNNDNNSYSLNNDNNNNDTANL